MPLTFEGRLSIDELVQAFEVSDGAIRTELRYANPLSFALLVRGDLFDFRLTEKPLLLPPDSHYREGN